MAIDRRAGGNRRGTGIRFLVVDEIACVDGRGFVRLLRWPVSEEKPNNSRVHATYTDPPNYACFAF